MCPRNQGANAQLVNIWGEDAVKSALANGQTACWSLLQHLSAPQSVLPKRKQPSASSEPPPPPPGTAQGHSVLDAYHALKASKMRGDVDTRNPYYTMIELVTTPGLWVMFLFAWCTANLSIATLISVCWQV